EYYSDDHGNWASDNCYPNGQTPQSCSVAGSHITPTFNFVKKETWGYSLNGKEFLVPQGQPYTVVHDAFEETTARILDGMNNSTATDYTARHLTKTVDTGWSERTQGIESDIFTLWGMTDLGTEQTDVFTLSMSYDHNRANREEIEHGLFALVTKDSQGKWVNAVDKNFGGIKKFVHGPWQQGYGLGTYGVDPHTYTAWAVINHNSDFAVAKLHGELKESREQREE
ncbi:MAG TPA: hypothetical protein VLX29_08400, partial [Nitrospirota bacterium]|nr:hypothetical protein [Nitrospirota bacterium]